MLPLKKLITTKLKHMVTTAVIADKAATKIVKETKKKRMPKRLTVTDLQDRIRLLPLQDKIYLCKALKESVVKEAAELTTLAQEASNL
jgi:hypothetical protein